MVGFLATIFTQFSGAFFGILISYLLAKDAGNYYRILPAISPTTNPPVASLYNEGDSIFWGRIVF